MARAAQDDPYVHGYRSFCSLSEGRAVCVMDAPDRESLTAWFRRMKMPWDSIVPLEYEAESGAVHPVEKPQISMAGMV
jgi:hypothetical protein